MATVANDDRRRLLATGFMTLIASHFGTPRSAGAQSTRLPITGEMPSLGGATTWLNSPPLTAAGLRGKVILVIFWTYTCINWRRSLPYVRVHVRVRQQRVTLSRRCCSTATSCCSSSCLWNRSDSPFRPFRFSLASVPWRAQVV